MAISVVMPPPFFHGIRRIVSGNSSLMAYGASTGWRSMRDFARVINLGAACPGQPAAARRPGAGLTVRRPGEGNRLPTC
ncbi:hypothetical protein MAFF211271_08290 [Ralstonia syzygii subsp. indonesiensis]|nr:hypothetical protein MAFF211271_08290 [Ralstonia pseudosolanacearum]